MKKFSFQVVIPSYNGLPLLKKHLPEVIKHSPENTGIIVVDDGSVDGTQQFLEEKYPGITCLHHHPNLGFPKSVNLGFAASQADLVVLLNNDVSPKPGYLTGVDRYFRKKDHLFAVTLNEINSSWPVVSYSGKLQYLRGEDKTAPHYSTWASGGSAVFSRNFWNKLGGFDEIYSPGYWEDIDLGWRAWKAGLWIIWDPKSLVDHQHESTFNLFNREQINLIKQRNELLFNWKNITDPDLRHEHLIYLLRYSLTHPGYLKVIFAALLLLPHLKAVKNAKRTDKEILSLINKPLDID
jgi:GT2 family glycosyltransferase